MILNLPRKKNSIVSRVFYKFLELFWECRDKLGTLLPVYSPPPSTKKSNDECQKKILYASPVGRLGKRNLSRVIHSFGYDKFDYLIFVYDDTRFDEAVFKHCRFIREKGILCCFFKKYLTPDFCRSYDYIFTWVDDINISGFSVDHFLEVFERNSLDMAQPALSRHSLYSHALTLQQAGSVGRFTDFVELMAQVFTRQAWEKYWMLLESDRCFWGWGYDYLAKSFCGFERMGIIDCEAVTHRRRSSWRTKAKEEESELLKKHQHLTASGVIELGAMK